MTALRGEDIVPDTKVNYGISQGLTPPYVSVMDYQHVLTYDTSGPALKEATFKVVVIGKDEEEAEDIATDVDTFFNNNRTVTDQTVGCFQESYRVGQMEERLYQFGVEIVYKLTEDPTIDTTP